MSESRFAMSRRNFLSSASMVVGGLSTAGAFGTGGGANAPRPNILMITCHDIGQHVGCYGVGTVQTANIDRLAARGIRFSNFYSTSAVCSPGRGGLHTGRYPQSNGLMGLTHAPWWWKLNEGERHTAVILKDIGYTTHLIGFNHVDGDTDRLGYETQASQQCRASETVQATRELIRNARPSNRPFFAKVGFTEVHRPFTHGSDTEKGVFVPPYLQDTEQITVDLAAFQATIRFFDQRIGEILDTLYSSKIAGNTLVVMTADHGIPYPGAKWSVRKAGIEIPLILYQPGTVFAGGKTFEALMSNIDVLPTLLDYLEVDIPSSIQGVSFKALIEGTTTSSPRKEVFAQYTPDMKRDNLSRCILTERYHLIRYFDQGRAVDYPVDVHPQEFAAHHVRCKTTGTRPFVQLFDLREDPYELDDIGSKPENAHLVRDLSKRLLSWMRDVNDPLLKGPLRTPYYDKAIGDLLTVDD